MPALPVVVGALALVAPEGAPPLLDELEPFGTVDVFGAGELPAGDVPAGDVPVGEGVPADVECPVVGLEDELWCAVGVRDAEELAEGRGRGFGSPRGVPGSTGGSLGGCRGLTLEGSGDVGNTGTRMLPTPAAYTRSSCRTIAM